jgi:predicted transcriptional regulator
MKIIRCPKCNRTFPLCFCNAHDVSEKVISKEEIEQGFNIQEREDVVGVFFKDKALLYATPGALNKNKITEVIEEELKVLVG